MDPLDKLETDHYRELPKLIKSLIAKFGVNVKVRKTKPADRYTKIHGTTSNQYNTTPSLVRILLTNYNFAPYNSLHIGNFDEADAYDLSNTLEEGDLVTITRKDGRTRNYKVISKEGIGKTQVVMYKYKLSSTSED